MTGRIVLLDDSNDPQRLMETGWPAETHLLVLFWSAEGTLQRLRQQPGVTCHSLLDIVGGLAHWERRAADLAIRLCDSGPRIDTLPWRRLVEEPLYREALEMVAFYDTYALVNRLAERLAKSSEQPSIELCLAPARCRLWHALAGPEEALRGEVFDQKASQDLVKSSQARPSVSHRLLRRARRIVATGDVRGQVWNLLDQLDCTYRGRYAWNRRRGTPKLKTGGMTFFSSYRNNSRNLRHVEDVLQETPTWLVTNRYARLGCQGTQGQIWDLYRFADGVQLVAPSEEPMPDLSEVVEDFNVHHLPVATVRRLLVSWLSQSPAWNYWQQRGHRALANLASCWQHYLDVAQPRLVVMGGQWSLEGWLAHMAQARHIPVLQVHHGITSGEYYTGQPIPSDALLVSGDFWRRLWPPEERHPIHVLPLAQGASVDRQESDDLPRLTYFSWPLDQLPFYNAHELMNGFADLLQQLLQEKRCRVHVRCHPLENPADVIGHWKERYGTAPEGMTWGQDEPLTEVIATTDVALMFRSTTMLNCLAHDIPFLLPGWIDFTWRPQLQGLAGIHVAKDFSDLATTLRAWLDDPPLPAPEQRQDFLGPQLDARRALAQRIEALIAPGVEGAAP